MKEVYFGKEELITLLMIALGFTALKLAYTFGRITAQVENLIDQFEDTKPQTDA